MKGFKEFITEAPKYLPVTKGDVTLADLSDAITTADGNTSYKKRKDCFCVAHPNKPNRKIYVKKKPQSVLIQAPEAGGFLGYAYKVDRFYAQRRTEHSSDIAKDGASARVKKSHVTRRINK